LEASPSKDLVSFVYCPDPKFANKARVVGFDSYTVWHVNADFGSGTT
jgi:hypothetical protein